MLLIFLIMFPALFVFVILVGSIFISIKRHKIIDKLKRQKEYLSFKVLCEDRSANFFGIKSLGYKQIRGNGLLFLTKNKLYFNRFFPEKEIIILITSIVGIKTPKSFLGKSIFRELLQVNFINENGEQDSAAWYVKNLKVFKTELEKILNNKIPK